MQLKKIKSHTSNQKKTSATSSTQRGTKKATLKAAKLTGKSKTVKKKDEAARLRREKKLEELTLKMFRQVYDDYQQGKFHRI